MELDRNNCINFYKQVAPTGLFLESIIFIPGGETALHHERFLWKFILIVNESHSFTGIGLWGETGMAILGYPVNRIIGIPGSFMDSIHETHDIICVNHEDDNVVYYESDCLTPAYPGKQYPDQPRKNDPVFDEKPDAVNW